MNRVLVTGARGFTGRAVLAALRRDSRWVVRASSRAVADADVDHVEWRRAPDLGPDAEWAPVLTGCRAVIHLAARVHMMGRAGHDEGAFDRANTAGTRRLAQQAAAAGVQRFVFVSSIKVLGESGAMDHTSQPAPLDAYGRSKHAAEQALWAIAAETGLEVVVVRPPLVYGPGVTANFRALIDVVQRGVPLPFGAVDNRRSLVGVSNLADLLRVTIEHVGAPGHAWLVRDSLDVSTPDLVRAIAGALGVRPRLMGIPPRALALGGRVLGRAAMMERLLGSLTVDDRLTRERLGWAPVRDMSVELGETVAQWRKMEHDE